MFTFDVRAFWKQGGFAGNYKSRLLANHAAQSLAGTRHEEVPKENFDRGATVAQGIPAQHLWCPFEDEHGGDGGSGFYVADAADNKGRSWFHCCHTNSCQQDRGNGGNGVEAWHYVKRYIELGLLTLADLRDRGFYAGGKVPDCVRVMPTIESITAAIAKLEKTSAFEDIDPILEDIAWFNDDGFTEDAVEEICERIGKPRKTVYRKAISKRTKKLGKSTRDQAEEQGEREDYNAIIDGYAKRYIVVLSGGKGYYYDTEQSAMSDALIFRDDFVFTHNKDWLEDEGGVVHPAKAFVHTPPKHAQAYLGGFIYAPPGAPIQPSAEQFNLYKPITVQPKSEGSCSLVHDLLRQVWAHGNEDEYLWALEWFYFKIRFPGARLSTSLAVRGAQGDGKTRMFELCMQDILGESLIIVADETFVLGDFNDSMAGRQLIMLDEAAFAGDRKAFDKLKSHIMSDLLRINAKHKAAFSIANYASFALVSNHKHFTCIEHDDRRYTVYNTESSWNGDNQKWEAFEHQWRNGGMERFVYEALTHDFRRLKDSNVLVVQRNVVTKEAVRQKALSRNPLEKCVVSLLIDGHLTPGASSEEGLRFWHYDKTLRIASRKLCAKARGWLTDFDERAARYDLTEDSLIAALEDFIGKTVKSRPKVKDKDGKWVQGPTLRGLIHRGLALRLAWERGKITDTEFESGGGVLPG